MCSLPQVGLRTCYDGIFNQIEFETFKLLGLPVACQTASNFILLLQLTRFDAEICGRGIMIYV